MEDFIIRDSHFDEDGYWIEDFTTYRENLIFRMTNTDRRYIFKRGLGTTGMIDFGKHTIIISDSLAAGRQITGHAIKVFGGVQGLTIDCYSLSVGFNLVVRNHVNIHSLEVSGNFNSPSCKVKCDYINVKNSLHVDRIEADTIIAGEQLLAKRIEAKSIKAGVSFIGK